jgi:hypothetical protein
VAALLATTPSFVVATLTIAAILELASSKVLRSDTLVSIPFVPSMWAFAEIAYPEMATDAALVEEAMANVVAFPMSSPRIDVRVRVDVEPFLTSREAATGTPIVKSTGIAVKPLRGE